MQVLFPGSCVWKPYVRRGPGLQLTQQAGRYRFTDFEIYVGARGRVLKT